MQRDAPLTFALVKTEKGGEIIANAREKGAITVNIILLNDETSSRRMHAYLARLIIARILKQHWRVSVLIATITLHRMTRYRAAKREKINTIDCLCSALGDTVQAVKDVGLRWHDGALHETQVLLQGAKGRNRDIGAQAFER